MLIKRWLVVLPFRIRRSWVRPAEELERASIGVAACSLRPRARSAKIIPFCNPDTVLHVSLSKPVAVPVTSCNTYISVLHTSLRLSTIITTDLRCRTPMNPFAQTKFDQASQLFHQRKYWVILTVPAWSQPPVLAYRSRKYHIST